MNLVGRVPGNVPALMPLMPLTPARAPFQNHRGVPPGSSSVESLRAPKACTLVHGDPYALPYSPTFPTAVQSVPPSTRGLFIVHPAGESSSSVPRVIYAPRGQKRVREDEWHDSPRARASPGCYTPDGRSMDGLGNTPDASPEVAYTSTPHGPAFTFGPPDTPSPRSSARKSTGSAYLSGSFRARRSLPHRGTRASAVLPSGPLALEEDEIPRFSGGL
jgi:hypothetical protein